MKDGCEILARVVGKSVEEYLQENLNADREREPEGWVVSQWDLDNKKFFYELEEGARKRSENPFSFVGPSRELKNEAVTWEDFQALEAQILNEFPCASKMIFLDEYKGYAVQIRMRCSHCGLLKRMSPRSWVLRGGFCERCSGTPQYPFDSYKKKIEARFPEVEMRSYYHKGQRMLFACKSCGYEWSANQYQIEASRGCPACALKRMESLVASQLKQYCLGEFRHVYCEYRILRSPETGAFLPFDIYIEDVNLFVEVNGPQHYRWDRQYKGTPQTGSKRHRRKMARKRFIRRVRVDEYKKQYAEQHGYYLAIDIQKYNTCAKAVERLWQEIFLIVEAKKP